MFRDGKLWKERSLLIQERVVVSATWAVKGPQTGKAEAARFFCGLMAAIDSLGTLDRAENRGNSHTDGEG